MRKDAIANFSEQCCQGPGYARFPPSQRIPTCLQVSCVCNLIAVVACTGRAARRGRNVAAAEKKQKLMWEALREAVDEEMEADPTVCLMGVLLHSLVNPRNRPVSPRMPALCLWSLQCSVSGARQVLAVQRL